MEISRIDSEAHGEGYEVVLEYLISTRERPNIQDFPFDYEGSQRMNDIYTTSTPDGPLHIYAWNFLQPPMICDECADGGIGTITLETGGWPTHQLIDAEKRRLPKTIRHKVKNRRLKVDEGVYAALESIHEQILPWWIPYVTFAQGQPLFLTDIRTAFDRNPYGEHETSDGALEQLVEQTNAIAKSIMCKYDGIMYDDHQWFSPGVDLKDLTRIQLSNIEGIVRNEMSIEAAVEHLTEERKIVQFLRRT